MRDIAELVKALRTCKLSIPCSECPYYSYGDEPSKECGTINDAAADVIEELVARNQEQEYVIRLLHIEKETFKTFFGREVSK